MSFLKFFKKSIDKKSFEQLLADKEKQDSSKQPQSNETLKRSLHENLKKIREAFGNSSDIVTREIRIGRQGEIRVGIIYTDGLINSEANHNFVMESLMFELRRNEVDLKDLAGLTLLNYIKEMVLTVGSIEDVHDFNVITNAVLSGKVVLLFDGYEQGFAVEMKGGKERGVQETTTETTIRGPREGFTENLRVNTSLIRRKIKDHRLWIESKKVGKVTKTEVSIMYIKGIVREEVVQEVRSRIEQIDIDGILESGYIEELIQDDSYTPFPTIYNTERPDIVAGHLLEGRVAILVDGTPFVLTVPSIFVQFLQSPEDYYQRADISSLIRFLRFFGFFTALLAPSLYVAITTFHQEMLPTQLLISLAAQREGVPFPAFIEAFLMEIMLEILREAGLRMPRAIGQAVSIVGTLVVGTAAVDAGIVSAAMVIVVAFTAISSFMVSSYDLAITVRMLRFVFMGLAASFGLFGIILGLVALVLHLSSLRSFGVPYLSPMAPFTLADQKDVFIRLPRRLLIFRPRVFSSQQNTKREKSLFQNENQRKKK
ncbi:MULTISPECIES: spore germination protein [Aeribacillus]|jgi:spore germination protein KA|uniref:Spore germination protein n=1 Tax=Aeribacillus composti TaxID=1868734 RepID=A0ABY9WAD3_9BACI|nr:spore germination protein [Aeribacillus composti]MED0701955.1 spore germination protein [Aeribacillus composti]WNF32459.1 spore germination protein [Aeribacillus composti]